jgi:hypothetical protein
MWLWPKLQLTDTEKKYVSIYKETDSKGKTLKPGVLRRAYRLQLANQAQPSRNIPAMKFIDQVQLSRRARIFAIMFSGNTDTWSLSVRNTNGQQYTNPSPRGQRFPVVSSLVAGSYYNSLALGGVAPPLVHYATPSIGPAPGFSTQFMSGIQSFPWLIEPNWVCQPNETLIFQGFDNSPAWSFGETVPADTAPQPPFVTPPTVLNITLFVWEFPGMGA